MNDLEALIGRLLGDWATLISDQALDADPALRARLDALEGRTVELQCTAPRAVWHMRIRAGRLAFAYGAVEAPHVVVRGSGASLVQWLLGQSGGGSVQIEGEDTLLITLLETLRQYRPDLESSFTRLFGAGRGAEVLGAAEMGLRGLKSLLQGAGQTVQDTAADVFVDRTRFDSLLQRVDALRLRVDRLAARIDELHRQPPA